MSDKYRYTGPDNKKCPLCGSREGVGPPVLYFVRDNKFGQHKWCVHCFNVVQRMIAHAHTEKEIELLSPGLTQHATKALRPHNIPDDHVVKGFHLMNVPDQGLTLVMEFQHEW